MSNYGYGQLPTGFGASQSTGNSWQTSSNAPVDTADAQLSREISGVATQYAGQVFNWANSTLAPNQALTNQAVGMFQNAAATQFGVASETANQYQELSPQALANLGTQANTYNSAARQQFAAGQAEANSLQGSQAGITNAEQTLQGFGINPNSGMYGELEESQKAAAGAAAAASGTQAAQNVQQTGLGLQAQYVNALQQLPGQSANAAAAGIGAETGAANTQFGNTAVSANALDASNPFLSSAQNISSEGTGGTSTGGSTQQSTSSNATNTNVPIVTTHYSGLKSGGAIPDGSDATTGGFVSRHLSPSGGGQTDDIPARLNADEFVIPKDVTKWYGHKTFQDMIKKARTGMGNPHSAPAKPEMKPALAASGAIPMG